MTTDWHVALSAGGQNVQHRCDSGVNRHVCCHQLSDDANGQAVGVAAVCVRFSAPAPSGGSAGTGNARSLLALQPSPDRDTASLLAVGLYLHGHTYRRFYPALPPADNPALLLPSASHAQSHGNV